MTQDMTSRRLIQLPRAVSIVEVGPRDGLQNEEGIVPTPKKADFVLSLARAGLRHIEFSSFVRADIVPQLADAEALFARLKDSDELAGSRLTALVPNERGLARAIACGVRSIAVIVAVSEPFNKANLRSTTRQALKRAVDTTRSALRSGLDVRAYVSTAFHCPFAGNVPADETLAIIDSLREEGVGEISIADTTGHAYPRQIDQLLGRLGESRSLGDIALHLHDTHGRALANSLVGLLHGVRTFDTSAGGLGGCPFAPGAMGNLATETLVDFLESQGVSTGVDADKVRDAGKTLSRA